MNSLKQEIYNFIIKNKNCFSYLLQHVKKYESYKNEILNYELEKTDLPFLTRLYWYLNDIHEYPVCQNPNCKKELNHDQKCNPINGYSMHYCCQSCSQKDPKVQQKIINNNLKKYGVERPQKTDNYKNNLKEIFSKRSEKDQTQINEKRKQTCLEKYGYGNVSQNPEIHEKQINSLLSRSEEEKEFTKIKTKKTLKEKYGIENYVNAEKIKQTISKFSTEKQQQINEKRKQTCLEKYGCQSVLNVSKIKNKQKETIKINNGIKFYDKILNDNDVIPLFSLEEFIDNQHQILKWKCKHCQKEFESKKYEHQSHIARCLDCFPLSEPISNCEKEIVDFLKENTTMSIIENSRKIISPNEIDIYIPEKKIAIELNGIYWHSVDLGTDKNYHLNKTVDCEKQDIQLIHIFDVEWKNKKEIIKSRLLNLLGIYKKTVFARKCDIKTVSTIDCKNFLNENHLQGQIISKINLGLFYNDELISLMTFGKCRFNKKYEWELLRFCNKLGYHIPGAASKLLTYFEKNYKPKSLISYADRRWSRGNVYEKLGFELDHISRPDYWYWNYRKGITNLEHRTKYQKYKLKNILENFDESKTEIENMKNNGYFRIYDSGNLVFKKIYSI